MFHGFNRREHKSADDIKHFLRILIFEIIPAHSAADFRIRKKIGWLTGSPKIFAIFSFSCSFLSKERMNIRYVNCSMTVKGFVIPPEYK